MALNKNLSGIHKPKRVEVYNTNNELINSFSSVRRCAKGMKIPTTTLYKAIINNRCINNIYFKYGQTTN